MRWICKFIYEKLLGWKTSGQFPGLDQYVVIVRHIPVGTISIWASWLDVCCLLKSISWPKRNFFHFLSAGFFVPWEDRPWTGLKAKIPLPIRLRYFAKILLLNWQSPPKGPGKKLNAGKQGFITLPNWQRCRSSW